MKWAAERVRRGVVTLCQTLLAKGIRSDDGTPNVYETYWVEATLYEAWVGLGQGETAAAQALAGKLAIAPESWMPETMAAQVAKLRAFMA